MQIWQRWISAPHTLWIRKFILQIHLWLGLGFGVYVLTICVTGSASILSTLFQQWFVPSTVASFTSTPLQGAALAEKIAQVYSDYEVIDSMVSSLPENSVYVTLQKDGTQSARFFDHYSGQDLGGPDSWPVAVIDSLSNFHDDLFLGRTGRQLNGIGGALFLVMALTGLFIWWQGKTRWHEGLLIKSKSTRSFIWQLHSSIGFWSLLLVFAWGISALYFVFPSPFDRLIDALDNDLNDFDRPDAALQLMTKIHLARFESDWLRMLWAVLGMLPVVMFVTGFVLWWRRVIRSSKAPFVPV